MEPEAAPEAAPEAETDAVELSQISELAEHLGIEPTELYQLQVQISEGDSTESVTIGELKDNIAEARRITRENAQAAEKRAESQQAIERQMQAAHQALMESSALAEALEQRFNADVAAVDWNALRETDPSEWSAKRQELAERQNQIAHLKNDVAIKFQQTQEQQQAEMQAQHQSYLAGERQALLQALPTWKDDAVATAEMSALREYLTGLGFSANEVSTVADHRLVVLANKARAYDQHSKTADTAAKRVVKIANRTLQPGTPPNKRSASQERERALQKALKSSGSVNDAAALIGARLKGM